MITLLALRALARAQGLTVDPGYPFIYLWRGAKIVSPPFKTNQQAADWLAESLAYRRAKQSEVKA